ncbi:hypothetical protein P8C59_007655 [Phyllachora maydis]|uniref:Uncharacterized protein n=1 Tax=Phyllachora maydis TaxID=1825666 RepID=A0AAD9MEF0_9PEZI|nr:hypothetical protein P8C59_007655 [Phyllachora maydis]
MYFSRIITTLGLLALAQACTPGHYACGNQDGAPGPDGSVQVCNSSGDWVFSAQCNGAGCCYDNGAGNAYCKC